MPIQKNRRELLRFAAASAAAFAANPTAVLAQEPPPFIRKPETPEQAVQLLMEGNQRFVTQAMSSFKADLAAFRKHSEPHQDPFATVLTCADSRVPPELVFDQSLGQLFVVRVAGNFVAPDTIASMEYSGVVVGVKTILVVGHTNCGAIKAAIEHKPEPGQITSLYQYLRPAVLHTEDVTEGSKANARMQANLLRESSPVLADLIKDGKLSIRAAIYDVGSGKVTLLDS